MGVPAAVAAAFGLQGTPHRLAGGQGHAFRVGDAVVKPVDDAREAAWSAEVLANLPEDGFRVARPIATDEGRWVVDGWAAWRWVEGAPATDRWEEVLAVGRSFTDALAGIEPPELRRRSPWAIADRAAWGEEQAPVPDRLRPLVDRVGGRLRPVDAPVQVIHGDLTGNVLFARGLRPAVIDFSPYVRPAAFPLAVVVVDALAWHAADPGLVHALDAEPHAGQLLLRAALFRLHAAARLGPAVIESEARAFEPVVALLERDSRP